MANVFLAKSVRAKRETGAGYRNTTSRILAGPAQGCNNATVRVLTIRPEGRVPRREFDSQRIITLLQGELIFMDGDGSMHMLGEGDTVIIHPHERYHFRNDSSKNARIMIIESRGRTSLTTLTE
ncbi:MAG: cupin domain-containing protein [Candidatus Aegiribacteria sp.]|nr:cupin domain-containing protein [Candidatus Aegiribacteria sp.]